ncbi:MAG: sensor histidine kinase, partial [Devosia sp.]
HELATNASKYGALSSDAGTIAIDWAKRRGDRDNVFELNWREHGGPPVAEPTRRGFGSRLIERVLTADFGGAVELDYAPGGLHFTLSAPLANLGNVLPSPFAEIEGAAR